MSTIKMICAGRKHVPKVFKCQDDAIELYVTYETPRSEKGEKHEKMLTLGLQLAVWAATRAACS